MADAVDKNVLFHFSVVLLIMSSQTAHSSGKNGLPNVILLVVDNLGLSDLGCFGNTTVKTPNIDKLAMQGMRFTRWYSQSSSLSTRASILTGKLPIRTGIIKSRYLPYKAIPSLASSGGLQLDQTTLGEVMRNKGYSTAFVGHWGLGVGRKGAFLPMYQGFDRWYGVPALHNNYCLLRSFNQTNEMYHASYEYPNEERSTVYLVVVLLFTTIIGVLVALWMFRKIDTMTLVLLAAPELLVLYLSYFSVHLMDFFHSRNCVLYRDSKIIEQPYTVNNLTLRFTRETVHVMKDFSAKKTPFFVILSHLKMHGPLYLSQPFSNCSDKNLFLCSLSELDWSVGRIMRTIEDLGLETDTIVLLTSTGGPCLDTDGSCGRGYGYMTADGVKQKPLKGGGNNVWEGDLRVPTIVWWKEKIHPGQIINETTSCMDVLPTLMELTNQSLDTFHTDGKSLVPLLVNSSAASQHRLVFHYTDIFRPAGVTYGRYKFVFITQTDDQSSIYHDPPILYDIVSDPSETMPIPIDQFPGDLLSTVMTIVEEHLGNRTDKGISQFDNPFLPLFFPCANLPSCRKVNTEEDDFKELLDDQQYSRE
ncbi:hypothetical protein QZH41_008666 [Actinostola sp. cb2023]|nr:hypothetical protein QZH41_008666 [Actinostola sp. cb2023]